MRRQFLNRNPLCAECERQGFTVAAQEMDHIVPVRRAPHRIFDPDNLQGLCRTCHETKTALENEGPFGEHRRAFDALMDRIVHRDR